ncbi:UNVERIFIED_CONTAM: hypothetical protein GTU68_066079 [Idotea baltica]|nr:hypothetical protein [Idotea baltica]
MVGMEEEGVEEEVEEEVEGEEEEEVEVKPSTALRDRPLMVMELVSMLKFPKTSTCSMALQSNPQLVQLLMCPNQRLSTTSSTFVPPNRQLALTQSSSHHHNRNTSSTS